MARGCIPCGDHFRVEDRIADGSEEYLREGKGGWVWWCRATLQVRKIRWVGLGVHDADSKS